MSNMLKSLMQEKMLGMLTSMISPELIAEMLQKICAGILATQAADGKNYSLTACVRPDGTPDVNIWHMAEGRGMHWVKRIDFTQTDEIIKLIKSNGSGN